MRAQGIGECRTVRVCITDWKREVCVARRAGMPTSTTSARLRAAFAFVLLLGLGGMALWIALSGARVSGGIPWLPSAWNQVLGRAVFGAGGVVCLALARLAWRDVRFGSRSQLAS